MLVFPLRLSYVVIVYQNLDIFASTFLYFIKFLAANPFNFPNRANLQFFKKTTKKWEQKLIGH